MSAPTATAKLPIRCKPGDAFDAFVDPDRIVRFWLQAASAPLAPGAEVTWHFMVPGAKETVRVAAFDAPHRLAFDWSDGVAVRLDFEPFGDEETVVSVVASGFAGDDACAQAVNATEGFSLVLGDLKALLETGRSAGLVRDKARLIASAHDA